MDFIEYENKIKELNISHKKWFTDFIGENHDFFTNEYKPHLLINNFIKEPRDLFYLAFIIAFFGYDGEKYSSRGFLYFMKYNLLDVFTENNKLIYNLKEVEKRFYGNKTLVDEINKFDSENSFGVHVYRIWEAKFSGIKTNNFNKFYDKKYLSGLEKSEIFIREFIFLLNGFILNQNIFFDNLSEISFESLFCRLTNIKSTVNIFHNYGATFFFDYIKIIYYISKYLKIINFNDNADDFVDKQVLEKDGITVNSFMKEYFFFSVENKTISDFFDNTIEDIKRGLERFTGKTGDYYELFKEFYSYISCKYKNDSIYKNISTYEKLVYMENTLCFLGKKEKNI